MKGRVAAVGCALGLACANPWSVDRRGERLAELDEAIAALDAQVSELQAEEIRRVQAQLDAAATSGVYPPETLAVAERIGLDVPPMPAWQAAPLDGRQAGVTMDHGRVVLEGVREEYRVDVDEERWGGAAAEALGVEAYATPEAAIGQAIDAGMDEARAVVWGVEAALHGLDPYSRPVWPAQVQAWSEHHAGVSVGAGIELEQRSDGAILVTGLHRESLAWVSGLHVGDQVVAVNDASVATVADALTALAGEPQTTHQVTARRADMDRAFEVMSQALGRTTAYGWRSMEAGDMRSSTHQRDMDIIEHGIGYVRITSFAPGTDEEVASVIGRSRPCCSGVVLDLRGNPGGDVQAALNVADQWLEGGLVVEMAGRKAPRIDPPGPGEAAWNEATPGGVFVDVCTVVLVDQDTASAAEILAGVLQQRAHATVLGAPTAGKAVSQALRADDGLGVAWQVTNLAWALPDGTQLVAGEGVTPDVPYTPTPAESWQTARMAAVRQAPKQHPDGAPVPWLGPQVGEGFPKLAHDPMVLRAQRHMWASCF